MSDYRFPRIAGAVRWQGAVIRLHYGQVWPADDPFVKARPDLFAADPHEVTRSPQPRTQQTGEGEAKPKRARRAKADQ